MNQEDVGQIEELIQSDLSNVSTTIPAIVLRYDNKKQTVDVELAVKRPYFGNDATADQSIRLIKVPVLFPQGSDWVIAGPLKKGDAVLIHCSMFDCETWLIGDKNKVYQAGSKYYHDINSSFATTGAFTYNSPTHDSRFSDKFHIRQGDNYLTMENGIVKVEAAGGGSTITMINGKVTIKGNVMVDGDVIVDGISFLDHTHMENGSGNQTNKPTPV